MNSGLELQGLLGINHDARQYFFSKASEVWFEWLWKNGFLDSIKQKADDVIRYSYRMPELGYLERVVEKIPEKIVDFMLDVKISKETFNPEVVDRFLRICGSLSVDQLARIVPKIHQENWVRLMDQFNGYGFEYRALLEKVAEAKDEESLLLLAESVLSVRPKEKMEQLYSRFLNSPFYFTNLYELGVFEYLSEISDKNRERALKIASHTLGQVIALGRKEKDKVFGFAESYPLYDVDFFKHELRSGGGSWSRDDVKDLAATNKILIERLLKDACGQEDQVREVVKKYVDSLPDSRTVWRFRLFVWSLCPLVFKKELESAFFRVFEIENPFDVAGGAEYCRALISGFQAMSEQSKRHFVAQVFQKFGSGDEVRFGSRIIRSIKDQLTKPEIDEARKKFENFDIPYDPSPMIGEVRGGTVVPKVPDESEQDWAGAIPKILENLKSAWSPGVLVEYHPEADFLAPVNAEGVGNRLQAEIKKRLKEYAEAAESFFNRDALDAHYTYSYLQGMRDALKENADIAKAVDWKPLIKLAVAIKNSGEQDPFEKGSRDRANYGWLANWTSVHMSLTDVLKELIDEESGPLIEFEANREPLLTVFDYLLSYPDPVPSDEVNDTAKSRMKSPSDEDYKVSDPLTIAINSVRGRAFQAFLQFVYQDTKGVEEKVLPDDVKVLYEKILKQENTQAMMFMFGHYLYFFFYRDKEWIKGLLVQIFSPDPAKYTLYVAAWEGYLSTNLFKELFESLQSEYERAIQLSPDSYPKGRHYRSDLDEALAGHIALAYIHHDDFNLETSLFKDFWSKHIAKRHGAFISFTGRHVITRGGKEKWYIDNKTTIDEKLKKLWDWILIHCDEEEALREFGYWMTTKSDIFDATWLAERIDQTLKKTKGDVDWELGLTDSLLDLAKAAPKTTLSILRRYLVESQPQQQWLYMRLAENLKEVLEVIYKNEEMREEVYRLINDLLPLGNGRFWHLKEIVKDGA